MNIWAKPFEVVNSFRYSERFLPTLSMQLGPEEGLFKSKER
jgi:hypothetical protein